MHLELHHSKIAPSHAPFQKWNLPTNLQSDSSGPNPVPKLMSSCPRAGRAALLTPRGNVQGEAMCPLPFKLGLGNYCKGGG